MKKDMIIELLESQLKIAHETNLQLRSSISTLNETINDLRKTIVSLENKLQERDESLAKAKNQMRGLSKLVENKSEQQRNLTTITNVPQTTQDIITSEEEKQARCKARGNNGAKRNMHFEMETIIHDVYPENVKDGNLFNYRETTRYRMIPPRFIKDVYRVHTVKIGDSLYSAKAPLTPLQNSSFDGSFIAGIAQLRYLYSMPVERIVAYFNESGFNIDKQTAHGLLKKTASLFENLYRAMQKAVREDNYLCCDETYHKVLVSKQENIKGSKKGYVWVIAAVHLGLVYYFYDDGSRSEDVILKELKGYTGTIQSDGLRAYKKVAEQSEGRILRLACLQHCKRDFIDMKGNPDADKILSLCNELYKKEHEHKIGTDGWDVDDNLQWRQQYAPPILAELKELLEHLKTKVDIYPPKSQMYKSVNYMLGEWDGIEAIITGGDYSWDNNLIERLNRYISLSRKNSLFFGSHEGAKRACIFYSLACSCRMHKINFFEYLSDILNRNIILNNSRNTEDYRNLLPDRWSKQEQD